MAKNETNVAIEFDSPINANFRIAPLGRTVRGRFDVHRVREPNAGKLYSNWPEPIPSQVVEYDFATGEGAVVEPLHEARYAAIREKIEATGNGVPEKRQPFRVDPATFSHWIGGLVETGDAKVVVGKMASVEGTPKTRFHSATPVDPLDKLTAAINRQSELQEKLIEAIAKLASK